VPIEATSRTTVIPGVAAGTSNIDARRCRSAPASVTHIAITTSAKPACVTNHFSPSITQSPPSRRAVVSISVGSAPAPGSVSAKADRISPASSGARYRARCASVPKRARISAFPESGALLPKTIGA
jgi:hypothetical protein